MKLTKEWRKELIDAFGIVTIDAMPHQQAGILLTTRCSKTKTGQQTGIPKEFYVSRLNLNFYMFAERMGYRYAIISDKYGLHFDDEQLEYYDIHPQSLSDREKQSLGRIINDKATRRGFNSIVFYNTSPIMSMPYFQMLFYSGLKVYFITKLNEHQQLKLKGI